MRKFKRRQKKQLAALTIIVLIASIAAIMMLTPGFDIKEIKVTGNSVVKEEDVIRSAGITTGVNIFSVSLGSAEDGILQMGYVEEVRIKRRLPSTIEIAVVEEVGVAYIKAEEGYVIITADGRCIDVTDGLTKKDEDEKASASLPNLPLITGLKNVKYKVGEVITSDNTQQLTKLFACLHEFSKHGYVFNIREINMSNLNNIEFYYLTKELCVSVGNADGIYYMMECFGHILEHIKQNPKGYVDLKRLTYRKPEEQKSE